MDAIINLYKEKDISSFGAVKQIKKILGTKVGHTGTLDPMAAGILVLCIGQATKLASEIESENKVYIVEMEMGYSTTTYDTTGEVVNHIENYSLDIKKLNRIIPNFTGEIEQIPPMYSALKKDGVRLYKLARKNIEVERKSRLVTIDYIDIIEVNNNTVKFQTKVSKGTYIRSLVNDIGTKLGAYATMSSLERVCVGNFTKENSYTIEMIKNMYKKNDFSFFIKIEKMFSSLPKYILKDKKEYKLFINGNTICTNLLQDDKYLVYYENKFVGLGKLEYNRLKGYKYFGKN